MKKQSKQAYKINKKSKNTELGGKIVIFLILTTILVLPAILFSHGSTGRFFTFLTVEILLIVGLFMIFAYIAAGRSKRVKKDRKTEIHKVGELHISAGSSKPKSVSVSVSISE